MEAAYVTFLIGDWRRSREFAERGLTALLDSNNLRAFLQPLYNLGELSLYEGEWEEATRYAQECITIGQHLGRVDVLRDAHALLAEMALMRDDMEAALEHVRPLVGTPNWDEQVTFLLALGSAYVASGNLDGAEDAAAKAVAEVTRQRLPTGLVDALRLQGTIAIHRGAWHEAQAHLQRAIQLARDITYPWGEAQALYHYGLMWAHREAPDRARINWKPRPPYSARLGASHTVPKLTPQWRSVGPAPDDDRRKKFLRRLHPERFVISSPQAPAPRASATGHRPYSVCRVSSRPVARV